MNKEKKVLKYALSYWLENTVHIKNILAIIWKI